MVSHQGSSGAERRQHARLEHNIPVKISADDLDIVTETKNLSCSGAFCRVNKHIEPMTKLKLHLLLPMRKNNKITTKKITCQGVVVRSYASADGEYFDTAIFFSDINSRDSQVIGEFVESVMEEQSSRGKYN